MKKAAIMDYKSPIKDDIEPLIKYLKINRRLEEDSLANTKKFVYVIDQKFEYGNADNTVREIENSELQNINIYNPLQYEFSFGSADHLAIQINNTVNDRDSITYYLKRVYAADSNNPIITYKSLTNPNWVSLDGSDFILIPLNRNRYKYYYHNETNRVIFDDIADQVFAYSDIFMYDPKDARVKDGRFILDYLDHTGNTKPYVSKRRISSYYSKKGTHQRRVVTVKKNQLSGRVYLFPYIKNDGQNFTLEYKYVQKKFSRFDIKDQPTAISIQFTYIGALLYFLNNIIFYDENFDAIESKEYLSTIELTQHLVKALNPTAPVSFESAGIRQLFIDQYIRYVNKELSFYKNNLDGRLEIFYYTPKVFLKYLDTKLIWKVLGETLNGSVTNFWGLDEEDIILKLLIVLFEKSDSATTYLNTLFKEKNSKGTNYFKVLYQEIGGDNFTKLILLLIQQWNQSSYAKPKNRTYEKLGDIELNPLICGYTSGKSWSFFHENAEFSWSRGGYIMIEVTTESGVKSYEYHPYDLIAISNAENENFSFTAQQLNQISLVPAFALFAHSDVTFWKNTLTAAEYVGDAISIVTGAGFAWRSLRIVSAVAKATTTTQKIFMITRSAVGIMEVTAGSANIILKVTQYIDTPFGKKLASVFMWMEFASLGTEIAVGVAKRLSTSAKLALAEANAILKAELKGTKLSLDELKQIGHLLVGQLENVRYIVADEFRQLAGAIAKDLKDAGIQLLEFTEEALTALDDLGDELLRALGINRLDYQYALANGGYLVTHNGKGVFASKLEDLKGFFNAMSDHLKKGGKGRRGGKNINKIDKAFEAARIKKILENYIARRAELLNLERDPLINRFKERLEVKHFKIPDILSFRKQILNKYPLLKHRMDPVERNTIAINFAEFIINSTRNGKRVHKNHKVLSHSGHEKLYDIFADTIRDRKFIENVVDLRGRPKANDSEIKFIYHFLTEHLSKADEFIIETRNIYFTCTSCQRELIMLVDITESLGKKIKFIVHGNENINGWAQLKEYVK